MSKLFLSLLVLISCLLYSSCDEGEQCVRCTGKIESEIDNRYFKLLYNIDGDTVLVQRDSSSQSLSSFELCSTQLLKLVESEKIIKASGSVRTDCDDPNLKIIDLHSSEIIHSCLPPIPQLNGPYDLDNIWFVHYLQNADTTIYPPCEGESKMRFDVSEKLITGTASINWFEGYYINLNDSTIQIPDMLTRSLLVGTVSQGYFEKTLFGTLNSSTLTYSIEDNTLLINNKSKKTLIKLFIP